MSDAHGPPPQDSTLDSQSFQFSLRELLLLVTAVALTFGAASVAPWLIRLVAMLLVWAVLPTTLIIFAIYARGRIRTFAIGALVPLAIWIVDRSTISANSTTSWLAAPALAACCGFLAVQVRRFIHQRGWDRPGPGTPG